MVDNFVTDQNRSLININVDVYNEIDKDSVLNVAWELFYCITDLKLYIKLNGKAHEDDREFKHEIFRTVVDTKMLFKGAFANVIIRNVVENLLKAANFELKMPLEPVSLSILLFKKT